MSLDTNINAQLAEWVSQNSAKVDKPAEVPVEAQTEIPESTEESDKPMAEETPKEQTQEQTNSAIEEKVEDVTSWDADVVSEKVEPKIEFDWSSIGSALDIPEIKSKEDLIAKTTELKTKLKELQEAPLSGIPDEFKEVIEVTKSGADWKDYLAEQLIDYSKIDPIQLFEDEFFRGAVKDPKYFTEGKFDPVKADEALDALPDAMKDMYGKQLAQQKINEQRHKQQTMIAKAEARKEQASKALTSATKNLNELLPLENFGIKFEPRHSTEIYQGIADSSLTKELLGGMSYQDLVKSGADMKSVVKTIALAKYAEKMLKYKSQNAKVEAKKEILDKIQNPQIRSTGTKVQPETEGKKTLTADQILEQHFSKMRQGL